MNLISDDTEKTHQRNDFVHAFEDACCLESIGSSVIANYGNKRTYIVYDIRFEPGPENANFELRNGDKMSIADYFDKTYKLKCTQK